MLLAAVGPFSSRPSYAADEPTLGGVTWVAPTCTPPPPKPPPRTGPGAESLGFPGTLITALLPQAVQGALTLVGNALTQAGAPKSRHATSQASFALYRVEFPQAGTPTSTLAAVRFLNLCVAAVLGPTRTPLSSRQLSGSVPLSADLTIDPGVRAQLNVAFDMPRSTVVIAELEPSKDGTAFRLVPRYIEIAGALRDRAVGRERADTVTLSLLPPGGASDGAASAIRAFSFPHAAGPMTLSGPAAESHASSWIPLPALPEALQTRLTAAVTRRSDLETLELALATNATPDEIRRGRLERPRLQALIDADTLFLGEVAPYTWQRAPARETEAALQDTLRTAAITDAAALAVAQGAGNAAEMRVAEIKAAGSCRRLEAAGYSDPVCLTVAH